MRDLFLIIDEAGVIEGAGPAFAQVLGYSVPEIFGQPVRTFLEIPDRPSHFEPPYAWLGATLNPIMHGIHRDGRRLPLHVTQHEMQGGQGHLVLLLQDPAQAARVPNVFLQHKELYELATSQGRICVWEIDYRTNHLEFSTVMAELLGLAEAEIPTTVEGWAKHFHPDDWAAMEQAMERMLRRELSELNIEMRMVRTDGRMLWGLVRGTMQFDDQGQPIKIVGTNIDITTRKRAEQRASVEHAATRVLAAAPTLADASALILQAICEALDWDLGALWHVSTDADVLRCVQTWHKPAVAVEEFEAVTRHRTFDPGIGLPGRVWSSRQPAWVPDVVKDTNFPRAKFAAKAGLHVALAFPILLDDAVHGVIEFFSHEIEEPDQELLQTLSVIGTQIGQFIKRTKAEEERDRFFSLSLDLLCIIDTHGALRRVNPAFTRVFGYTADELTGHSSFEFIHPDHIDATRAAIAQAVGGKDVEAFENRARHRDGTYRWLSWTCAALAPGSELLYAVARDITLAKEVQLELERAKQEAERANRAKSEFLSRMSHELRTPLNAILGFSQLLQRDALSERQRKQIDLIGKGGRHLLALINEVLDITRIEVGRLDLSPESIELGELLTEVVSLNHPMAEQLGIDVVIDEPSVAEAHVVADKQRLKQVLLNLVSNAIKYNMTHGRVLVRCEAAPHTLRIHVEDTGAGIPLQKQARLFTPFDRLGAESTAIEGSGLGLVLSKRLVEVMGGALSFVSHPGQGSTFTVELANGKSPQAALDALPSPPAAHSIDPGLARTVLYIEDNHANVQLVEGILAYRPGIALVSAHNGEEGLGQARRHKPDLILLDVHLPDMKGSELLAAIRADADLRETPVIAISADATADQIDRLRGAGASEYLTKPIDVDHFLRVLDHYLRSTA